MYIYNLNCKVKSCKVVKLNHVNCKVKSWIMCSVTCACQVVSDFLWTYHRKSNRVPEKKKKPTIYFCFIDCAKAFDCVNHNKLWNILKEMEIPDHLTCLLRNLYVGQEATVRTGHGTDWFQIGKGIHQGCILSPCLFNLYAEYIMRNARLDEAQSGIKISGRNISNLRYADDTTLMVESEEELKSLLMKVKEENEKVGLKLNIQKIRSWPLVPSLHGK